MDEPRILFVVVGTYGDLHPFIAVALEMQARGWSPLLLAAPEYAAKAAAAGLAFAPMRPGLAEAKALAPDGPAFLRRLAADETFLMKEYLLPAAAHSYADVRPHVAGARLMVVNHFAFGGQTAAEAAGLPVAVLGMQPLVLFSAYDPPAVPGAAWLPKLGRLAGPWAVRRLLDLGEAVREKEGAPLRALRRQAGLPEAPASWLTVGVRNAVATIGLWSPLLGGPQPDNPPNTAIVGSLVYDEEPDLEGEAPLEAFLAAGPPPVVLTLGSFAGQAPGRFYVSGVEAARSLGLRSVVVGGPQPPEVIAALAAPDVHVAGYVRYSRLFSRARLVAHHGGMGTLHQALRAGVPQLCAPLFGDQPDNARRLEALGVGRTIPFSRFSPAAAARAMAALLQPQMAQRAAELAAVVAAEQGAGAAADVLEAALARQPAGRAI